MEAIRAGAIEYLAKPVDADDIAKVVEKAVATRAVHEKREALWQTQTNGKNGKSPIIYNSKAMQKLMKDVEQVRGQGERPDCRRDWNGQGDAGKTHP